MKNKEKHIFDIVLNQYITEKVLQHAKSLQYDWIMHIDSNSYEKQYSHSNNISSFLEVDGIKSLSEADFRFRITNDLVPQFMEEFKRVFVGYIHHKLADNHTMYIPERYTNNIHFSSPENIRSIMEDGILQVSGYENFVIINKHIYHMLKSSMSVYKKDQKFPESNILTKVDDGSFLFPKTGRSIQIYYSDIIDKDCLGTNQLHKLIVGSFSTNDPLFSLNIPIDDFFVDCSFEDKKLIVKSTCHAKIRPRRYDIDKFFLSAKF